MFMAVAIGAIGIGVILMVGYLVISQVRTALPTDVTYQDWNGTDIVTVNANTALGSSMGSVQATAFAGFGLIAVGIIVLAAFGIVNIFK